MKHIILLACMFTGSLWAFGQCEGDEIQVDIEISTDNWGYEGYWELVPLGNDCGDGTIFSGGNNLVGCDGGGDQAVGAGNGYGNNGTFSEGPICLLAGEYNIIFIDDYGDGGMGFEILVEGISTYEFVGSGASSVFTFNIQAPFTNDISIESSNLFGFSPASEHGLTSIIKNRGTETLTTLSFSYSLNGGTEVTSEISGLSLSAGESTEIAHDTPLDFSGSTGSNGVVLSVMNPNGVEDEYLADNDLTAQVQVFEAIPNQTEAYLNGGYYVTEVAGSAEGLNYPTDLDFHPNLDDNELWVLNRHNNEQGGSTVTISNAGESSQSEVWKQDGNAWHFMCYPTGIAFSSNSNFATSTGVFDSNHSASEPNGNPFTGPSLWSSDMSIYAEPSGGNGSHLDMLHQSPRSQGIAAESGNAFWLIDGHSDDIVRYDFVEDHGPGNDYHGDGIIRRYQLDEMQKDPANQIVSHLVLDEEKKWLYAVDHGNQRVIRLDITTGEESGANPSFAQTESVVEYSVYTNYTSEEIISGLSEPSGVEIIEDHLYVSDYGTGVVTIYDVSVSPAVELGTIETGYSSLQGLKIGPDGMLWGVDMVSSTVFKMTLGEVSVAEVEAQNKPFFYPNPAKENLYFYGSVSGTLSIYDTQGKLLMSEVISSSTRQLDLSGLSRGVYSVMITGENNSRSQVLVKE